MRTFFLNYYTLKSLKNSLESRLVKKYRSKKYLILNAGLRRDADKEKYKTK